MFGFCACCSYKYENDGSLRILLISFTKLRTNENGGNGTLYCFTFLLKKDLLMTRLTTFDEKPEHYLSWKVNFKGMLSELNVTPSEEIDLLIRWLGPDSGRHAKTIRSSLSSDPTWGVAKIWERLDERFGAPEMVEAAIKEIGNRCSAFVLVVHTNTKTTDHCGSY
jgi:hypothetical protein